MGYKISIDSNLLSYGDSLLYPSGLEIASVSFTTEDGDKKWVSLRTMGNVKIFYKGNTYKDVSQFPDDLVELFRTKKGYLPMLESGDLEIIENNWWELLDSDGEGEVLEIEPREYQSIGAVIDDLVNTLKEMMAK